MQSSNSDQPEEDVFRQLFILHTPSYDWKNRNQCLGLQLGVTLRHNIKIFPNAPHGFYIVDDDRAPGQREVFAFFKGSDIHQALHDERLARRMLAQSTIDTEGQVMSKQRALTSSSGVQSSSGHPHPVTGFPQGGPNSRTTSNVQRASSSSPRLPAMSSAGPAPSNLPPEAFSNHGDRRTPASTRIFAKDVNSLLPLSAAQVRMADYSNNGAVYTMTIRFDAKAEPDLFGLEFTVPIDTASPEFWIFQKGFKMAVEVTPLDAPCSSSQPAVSQTTTINADTGTGGIDRAMHDEHVDINPAPKVKYEVRDWNTPLGDMEDHGISELPEYEGTRKSERIEYADGGVVFVHYYPEGTELPALVPCWNWKGKEEASTPLRLPRVLAYAVNHIVWGQPYDGNIGLAMPGWTTVDSSYPSTFYQALTRGRLGRSHVDKPSHMTIRLLHPEVVASGKCPVNVRSYLYYGGYWPCAMTEVHGGATSPRKRVPPFTPKILVIPTDFIKLTTPRQSTWEKVYNYWMLRLLSMVLLVPRFPRIDKQAPIPWRGSDNIAEDWILRGNIVFTKNYFQSADIQGDPEIQEDPHTAIGLPIALDTCSAESVLPYDACKIIATEWLGLSADEDMYCPDDLDLDDHDILFTFLGEDDNRVEFRCTASRFLRSVWPGPGERGREVLIRGASLDPNMRTNWILGQNFFWTAFVRLDCSFMGDNTLPIEGPGTRVSVRLAAQRSEDAEGNMAEEISIAFHEVPGRIEALTTAGLKYDD